jgi:D-alanyl-D-alanine carboxypeptidase (penicillin-binding protein 5/6)
VRRRRRGAALLLVAAILASALVGGAGQAAAAPKQPAEEKPAPKQKGPGVLARSWALIDGRTGETLVSHAASKQLPIASTTKLMTAYVTLKDLPLDKIVRAAPYEAEFGESLMNLRPGQKISVRDLLYGLILRSGNDAAHTLALRAAGSLPKFVAQMNRYAAALGLSNTHYANPVGLDQKGNYSSAADLLVLSRHLLEIPAFAKIADSREHELTSTEPPRKLRTINQLLVDAPWVTGVKTGHTWGAAYVLVGSGRKKGVELISVAIGAPTDEARFSDDLDLLEWGFRQYGKRRPVKKGQQLAAPSIRYSGGELPLRAARTLTIGLRRGQKVETDVHAPSEVEGPIHRGRPLGSAAVLVDGRVAGHVALLASRGIPKASFVDRARDFLDKYWIPIAVAIFAILLIGILLVRRHSRRRNQRSRYG